MAATRSSEPVRGPMISRAHHSEQKTHFISDDHVRATIVENKAVVKILEANVEDEKSDDCHVLFFFQQFLDPKLYRPFAKLLAGSDRTKVYDTISRKWKTRELLGERGRYKIHVTHTKKTAVTLLPADGKMTLFNPEKNSIGVLFHSDQVAWHGSSSTTIKYVFQANARTNDRFWIHGQPEFMYASTYSATTLEDIVAENIKNQERGVVAFHNEAMARLCKPSAVFARADYLTCRLNALHKKFLLRSLLDLDVPTLVISPNEHFKFYFEAQQLQDVIEALQRGPDTAAHQLARKLLFQIRIYHSALWESLSLWDADIIPESYSLLKSMTCANVQKFLDSKPSEIVIYNTLLVAILFPEEFKASESKSGVITKDDCAVILAKELLQKLPSREWLLHSIFQRNFEVTHFFLKHHEFKFTEDELAQVFLQALLYKKFDIVHLMLDHPQSFNFNAVLKPRAHPAPCEIIPNLVGYSALDILIVHCQNFDNDLISTLLVKGAKYTRIIPSSVIDFIISTKNYAFIKTLISFPVLLEKLEMTDFEKLIVLLSLEEEFVMHKALIYAYKNHKDFLELSGLLSSEALTSSQQRKVIDLCNELKKRNGSLARPFSIADYEGTLLSLAAGNNHVFFVKQILERKELDGCSLLALDFAVLNLLYKGHYDLANEMLTAKPELKKETVTSLNADSHLHLIVKDKKLTEEKVIPLVTLILANNNSIAKLNKQGHFSLMIAIKNSYFKIAALIIEDEATLNQHNLPQLELTLLSLLEGNQFSLIEKLLFAKPEIGRERCLHTIMDNKQILGTKDEITLINKLKIFLNMIELPSGPSNKNTLLAKAIRNFSLDIVMLLIRSSAAFAEYSTDQLSYVMYLLYKRNLMDLASLVLEKRRDANTNWLEPDTGHSTLHILIQTPSRNEELIVRISDGMLDLSKDQTLLSLAVFKDRLPIAEKIIATSSIMACYSGESLISILDFLFTNRLYTLVEKLLAAKPSIPRVDLLEKICTGRIEPDLKLIQLVMANAATPLYLSSGKTFFSRLVKNNFDGVIHYVLSREDEPSIGPRPLVAYSAALLANEVNRLVYANNFFAAKLLITKRQDINLKIYTSSKAKHTIFHQLVLEDKQDVAFYDKVLLNVGDAANTCASHHTPLYFAIALKKYAIANLYLESRHHHTRLNYTDAQIHLVLRKAVVNHAYDFAKKLLSLRPNGASSSGCHNLVIDLALQSEIDIELLLRLLPHEFDILTKKGPDNDKTALFIFLQNKHFDAVETIIRFHAKNMLAEQINAVIEQLPLREVPKIVAIGDVGAKLSSNSLKKAFTAFATPPDEKHHASAYSLDFLKTISAKARNATFVKDLFFLTIKSTSSILAIVHLTAELNRLLPHLNYLLKKRGAFDFFKDSTTAYLQIIREAKNRILECITLHKNDVPPVAIDFLRAQPLDYTIPLSRVLETMKESKPIHRLP